MKFETTKGDFIVEVNPEWAPNGAAHVQELVEKKFYDGCGFFRNIPGFMVQFGMNGDPKVHAQWGEKNITDDPVKQSNKRGFVTYAQTGSPEQPLHAAVHQLRRQLRTRRAGDSPPSETIVEGMSVVDSLHKTGENPGETQGMIQQHGNEYLKKRYPELDYINTARIVPKP